MILGSIVLAGGQSRRMGQPKESLPWGDSTLLHSTLSTLLDCTHPVVVVARDEHQELPPLHTEVDLVFDSRPGEGPLVGIEAGMSALASHCDATLVVGCDAPFLTARSISGLADQLGDHRAVVPEIGGMRHPLCAIYRTSLLPLVRELVARGERKAQVLPEAIARGGGLRLLSRAEMELFDPDLAMLRNLNTQDDYQSARRDSATR